MRVVVVGGWLTLGLMIVTERWMVNPRIGGEAQRRKWIPGWMMDPRVDANLSVSDELQHELDVPRRMVDPMAATLPRVRV